MDLRDRESRWRTWRLPALLVVGMCVAAIAGFYFVNQVLQAARPEVVAVSTDPKTLGPANALVEIIEYSDFQ